MTCIDVGRKPPPQINPFREFVVDELIRRKNTFPSPILSPFIRFTSCLEDPERQYQFFSLGLHGYTSNENIFDQIYNSQREVVGYGWSIGTNERRLIDAAELTPGDFGSFLSKDSPKSQLNALLQAAVEQQEAQNIDLTAAHGAHPIPGITNVTVDRFSMGAGIRATVSWQCYNRQQLEFLRHHFMTAGTHVVLEWGHQSSHLSPNKILQFGNANIKKELAKCVVNGRKYINSTYTCPNNGNYDFIVGTVGNFTINIEPKTNIYRCSTVVYTSGENLWGMSIRRTVIDIADKSNRGSSFEDFFKTGNAYDAMLNSQEFDSKITKTQMNFTAQEASTNERYKDLSSNPNDYIFVTWEFFAKDLMEKLSSFFNTNVNVKKDITDLLKFINEQSDPNSSIKDKLWVGNNLYLRSVEPDYMLIIRKNLDAIPQEFTKAGYFDELDNQQGKGLLTRGIWLNAGMIRECFLQATTFEQAIRSILLRMNNAVSGYWNLQIYYDEDESIFRIIDQKYGSLDPNEIAGNGRPPLYRFNKGTLGELLELNFDSAFPPEVVTQLALVARIKSDPNLIEVVKKYPLFGTTSHFAYAMNWTNLKDVLFDEIKTLRDARVGTTVAPTQGSVSVGQTPNPSTTSRLISNQSNQSGIVTLTPSPPSPGVPSSIPPTPKLPNNAIATVADATLVSNAVRQEVFPRIPGHINTWENRAKKFEHIIRQNVSNLPMPLYPNVDGESLLKAIIAKESGFISNRMRREPQQDKHYTATQVASYGLMQILNTTAYNTPRGGYVNPVDSLALNDPSFNIKKGSEYLGQLMLTAAAANPNGGMGDLEQAIASYNAGPDVRRYTSEDVANFTSSDPSVRRNVKKFCIRYSSTEVGLCEEFAPIKEGAFPNQSYVDAVIAEYNLFLAVKNKKGLNTPKNLPIQPSTTLNTLTSPPPQPNREDSLTEEDIQQQKEADIRFKFGNQIAILIETNQTRMIRDIIRHGVENHEKGMYNGFVAPFPTTAKIELGISGIAGISIFDGFIVDKLPFIYEKYGIFHITQMRETITPKEGWRTHINGIFRFLYFDPKKMELVPTI